MPTISRGRIAVVGAGPSGIVSAKHLLAEGYDVTVYESSSSIGGTFANKSYDDGELVSSKYITPFSDLRLPKETPPHQTIPDYVSYLQDYSDKFKITERIRFQTSVLRVQRRNDGRYDVEHGSVDEDRSDGTTDDFDAVAVCSGLHNVPHIPDFAGIDSFTEAGGELLHSSEYKKKAIFEGKRVLVVGAGETAMDISYRSVQMADTTALAVRSGFLSVPTIFSTSNENLHGGLPLDTLITNLFEHCYEQKWVHQSRLKWAVTTVFIRLGFLFATGSSVGFNQWAGGTTPVARGYHILNKSTKAMPYINKPLKKKAPWWRFPKLYEWWDGKTLEGKQIDLYQAGISKMEGKVVHFTDGRTLEVDMIVLCTGYRQQFPFLHGGSSSESCSGSSCSSSSSSSRSRSDKRVSVSGDDSDTSPRQVSDFATASGDEQKGAQRMSRPRHRGAGGRGQEDPLPVEHHITDPDAPNLGFIGFVRPNVGAIPPMAELQVMWWIHRLQGKIRGPSKPGAPTYHVLGHKFEYGVDYGSYMHRIAEDIGAAPDLLSLEMWVRPKVLVAYCLGQAYISFFRLQGPFKHALAWDVSSDELFQPVLDRGLVSNLIFAAVCWVFGWINLVCWVIEKLTGL